MTRRIRTLAWAVTGAALLASSAAAQNDGHMDEVWMTWSVKGGANLVDYSTEPVTYELNVKSEVPQDVCYVHFSWAGADSYQYEVETVCQDSGGSWSVLGDETFGETAEGHVVSEYALLKGLLSDDVTLGTDGFHQFEPKVKSGEVTSVKFVGNKGKTMIAYYEDDSGEVYGFANVSVKTKFVDTEDVPQGARDALL